MEYPKIYHASKGIAWIYVCLWSAETMLLMFFSLRFVYDGGLDWVLMYVMLLRLDWVTLVLVLCVALSYVYFTLQTVWFVSQFFREYSIVIDDEGFMVNFSRRTRAWGKVSWTDVADFAVIDRRGEFGGSFYIRIFPKVTSDTFQKTTKPFLGDKQYIQFNIAGLNETTKEITEAFEKHIQRDV